MAEMATQEVPDRVTTNPLPHLYHGENGIQLIVKGKPFLMLSGELHNSSLSSARFMSEVYPAMKAQSINTLLGSVTWEMIEPVESQFDFVELDAVIAGAREQDMKLVLLWFGTYKNGMSTYVPHWVKRNTRRFPRVHVLEAGGVRRTVDMVSPLSEEACTSDSRAFGKLMAHLKEFDAEHSTVLMVQVENETGLLGDSRDRSPTAEKAFQQGIPPALVKHLASATDLHQRFKERFGKRLPSVEETSVAASKQENYTWASIFGPGAAANEAFMANAISSYVGRVAAAGKEEYGIPLYTNAWLDYGGNPSQLDLDLSGTPLVVGGGAEPGIYPSGGPLPHLSDIWRFNAPALEFLAPDLYLNDYEDVCRDYTGHADSPLFIPEQRRDAHGARRIWLAYATYGALGCSPFGIDTGAEAIGREFRLLEQTKSFLLGSKPSQRMGFFFDPLPEVGSPRGTQRWSKRFGSKGDLEVIVDRAFVFGKAGPGAGMVIQLGGEDSARFLAVGRGFNVRFKSHRDGVTFTGILDAREMEVLPETGELRVLRTLNGDETRSGQFLIMANDDPDYGSFPIAVTPGAGTCIAEVEAYWLCEDVSEM